MTPRVAIVIPTHNRLRQLQRAVASAEAQTYSDRELIVVDDGSSDGTAAWLSTQPTIRTVRTTVTGAGGAGAARNRGIEQAGGDYIAFLDDDDVWHPAYLERQIAFLSANDDASLSFADHIEVAADGKASHPDTAPLLHYSSPLVRMLAESFIHTMSVVVCRRRLFATVGPFNEGLAIVQDFEWYARLLAAGERVVQLRETLVERAVPGGLVTRHREWSREERPVVDGALAAGNAGSADARLVRAYRSLFFARLALSRRDLSFGVARMMEAMQTSSLWTARIAARRIARRFEHVPNAQRWDSARP